MPTTTLTDKEAEVEKNLLQAQDVYRSIPSLFPNEAAHFDHEINSLLYLLYARAYARMMRDLAAAVQQETEDHDGV